MIGQIEGLKICVYMDHYQIIEVTNWLHENDIPYETWTYAHPTNQPWDVLMEALFRPGMVGCKGFAFHLTSLDHVALFKLRWG
jgi:hypothetical protein